ncbi:MAG: hypothetical protein DYH12_32945, partial [Sorangiineae bacterium PRO1]|nr:hypothetical protein [Sorangiineae bacterium PRO1]
PASPLVVVTAAGGLKDFGLTELFFETSEPANAEVPIADVLARIPVGKCEYAGAMVGGPPSKLAADFTHVVPEGPALLAPATGATDVDPKSTVVKWQPVTKALGGAAVEIVGYQVIVEKDAEQVHSSGFYKPVFSVHLPATATSVTVPAELMESGAPYKFEVLAIEKSGNQTLASGAFQTQ